MQDIIKETISFHFIKWDIGVYFWKQIYSKNNLNDF